ncbi:uncharacterized protein [Onthophagus taurus]|uniref:uncharacterized protein n=1 Tax=Onthophagus taurus TaxID=166361 RepID=UPI000C20B782|nr:uncharacterized protein LOC111421029 [Onthophagus taurus]
MLNKSVIVLLLGIILCHKINAESCDDMELEPPQNFASYVDYYLYLSWMPPPGFGNCAVTYSLHIQNMNTSDYLTPVVYLNGLNYIFDYDKYDKMCVHVRAYIYAHYNGQSSSFATIMNFLDPVNEQGPPAYLYLNNTETALGIYWSTPIGYEKCDYYFTYWLAIGFKDSGHGMISFPLTGYYYSYTFPYPEGHQLYCQEVDVKVSGSFRGKPETSIIASAVFGPPGVC